MGGWGKPGGVSIGGSGGSGIPPQPVPHPTFCWWKCMMAAGSIDPYTGSADEGIGTGTITMIGVTARRCFTDLLLAAQQPESAPHIPLQHSLAVQQFMSLQHVPLGQRSLSLQQALLLQQLFSLQQSPHPPTRDGSSPRAGIVARAMTAARSAACQYRINMGRTSLFRMPRSGASGWKA